MPLTVDEALGQLERHADAKVLAGGQSLIPLLNFRMAHPERLIDITRVEELDYLRADGDVLRIGAITRQRDLAESPAIARHAPLLAAAVAHIGHPQIRNRGTIGGSVAHADPSAELPVALTALDARFVARSRAGEREIPAAEMFLNHMTTALAPDELLCEVVVPCAPAGAGAAFEEFSRRDGDFALAGAAVQITGDGRGGCRSAAIALLGAGPTPMRATAAERALAGTAPGEEEIAAAAERAVDGLRPTGDMHGSTEYRRRLLVAMTRRALARAIGMAP